MLSARLSQYSRLRPLFGRHLSGFGIKGADDMDEMLAKVAAAQEEFHEYSQAQVDHIFQKVAMEACKARLPLAKLAVEDTQRGIVEDKVIKNHFASEIVYNKYKDTKTCGVVEEDSARGYTKVAEPLGPVVAFAPVTNPTSTVIFKTLMAVKTRNAIVFSPHPTAAKCSNAAAQLCLDAAIEAGAPRHFLSYLEAPTRQLSDALLHHPTMRFALATGGPSIVSACYTSGKPAIGVGAGNAPALVDETADIDMAVSSIVMSKTFDNGMICAAEQAVVVVDAVYQQFMDALRLRGCHLLSPEEGRAVADTVITDSLAVNGAVVGQSAETIASMAGVTVPPGTLVLVAEASEVGDHEKWSFEKLSPVMSVYRAPDFDAGVRLSVALANHGGAGHTSALYTREGNRPRIDAFERAMPTFHVLVDSPTSFGAIGDLYNFHVAPSLTLGCGSIGGSSTSVNVGPEEMLNYKVVTEKRENMQWLKLPPTVYFKRGIIHEALRDLSATASRVMVVTDPVMLELGMVDTVTSALHGVKVYVHSDIQAEPSFQCVRDGIAAMGKFQPDTIIALGGGSPLDAAKVMRLLYEHPELDITALVARFMDIRKRITEFPRLGSKVRTLIEIPTTSGTGAEMTPFAVITGDDAYKYPICSYGLTPDMAIVDPEFAAGMPADLTANTGFDALTHAIESHVSVASTDYTQGMSIRAVQLLTANLAAAVHRPHDMEAREKMHNGSALAGMAFANAFLGISHSMSHALGAYLHLPHGLCNALVLSHVMLYNASSHPTKMGVFPQYKYPLAKRQYAELADAIGLPGLHGDGSDDGKLLALVARLEELKAEVGLPLSVAQAGISREKYAQLVPEMAEHAFDDQCTGANPRYPLISELEALFWDAFEGPPAALAAFQQKHAEN